MSNFTNFPPRLAALKWSAKQDFFWQEIYLSKHADKWAKAKKSVDHATSIIISKARGEFGLMELKTNSEGQSYLDIPDLKEYSVAAVRQGHPLNDRVVVLGIRKALKENDKKFFLSLAKSIRDQEKSENAAINFERVDKLPKLLIDCWLPELALETLPKGAVIKAFPPLAIFTDQALTELIEYAFNLRTGSLSKAKLIGWRSRTLQLERPTVFPKISQVIILGEKTIHLS